MKRVFPVVEVVVVPALFAGLRPLLRGRGIGVHVLGIHFAYVPVQRSQRAPLRLTFCWPASARWEGRDFAVAIESGD